MKTIVGFGASSMQGIGDPGGGFFSRLPRQAALAGLPLQWKNHGIGGNTLKDMLDRAPATTALKPYDLIVILGCNDLPRTPDADPEKRSSPSEYQSRVRELLKTVRGERSLFITSFAVSREKTGVDPKLLESTMAGALAAAAALGYETWDLHSETKTDAARFWAEDGLHFNAAGHALIADRVAAWIGAGSSA